MSRINRRVCLSAAVGVAVLLAAGCTDSSAGTPRPQGGTSTSVGGQSSEPSSPARPRELRLDGKDPCSLIPQADRAKFYIERPGVLGQNDVYKSPECTYSTDVGGFRVVLVMTEGIQKWTDGSKSAKAEQAAPVAEFPAISASLPGEKNRCEVAVDVADGQYLLAGAIVTSSKASQVPERCEYAHQLAESAMRTLVSA